MNEFIPKMMGAQIRKGSRELAQRFRCWASHSGVRRLGVVVRLSLLAYRRSLHAVKRVQRDFPFASVGS